VRLNAAVVPNFIQPPGEQPPTGPDWVHEIKHDGFRLMARRDRIGIRLITRNGYDWAPRYPLIVDGDSLTLTLVTKRIFPWTTML
jgi:ATP-dependent DNA ligase